MKVKRYKNVEEFGNELGVSSDRIEISKMKAKLKKRIIQETISKDITCAELAEISGLSRTVISGIVNGSLQSVSIERLIRLASALDLSVELSIKTAAIK